MDDSMSSTNYMINQSFSSTPENSSEESGWTFYFEDFLANNNNHDMDTEDISNSSSGYQNSSMVSDAAAMRKNGSSKKVSKNRKITAKTFVDEDLEDTASSPGHSPKVNDLNHLYMKSKELGPQDVCQDKGQASQHAGEGIDMGFLETQLRRKGLCLVPMSMLLNQLS